MLISPQNNIFIAGHKGMVGNAIFKELLKQGYKNIKTISRKELDLTNTLEVDYWFSINKPEIVILCAAKVGGIGANRNFPSEFLLENIKIEFNVIESSFKHGVKRLLFLGSSCIYPRLAQQPIIEEELLNGPLEPTNESYSLAKIVGIRLCNSLRIQFGFDAISVMPSNIYGPGDNYHPSHSHVIPSLIRKFYDAKNSNKNEVVCWGSGKPYREFLHVEDLAKACIFLLENWDPNSQKSPKNKSGEILTYLNVGTGDDLTIKDLAQKIKKIINFEGEIVWDKTKPDGIPRKQLDISRILNLGWKPYKNLDDGLKEVLEIYDKEFKRGLIEKN